MPDATHVGQVALRVADLDRSLAFYRDVVGFDVLDRIDTTGTRSTSLGVKGQHSVLLELHESPHARPIPSRGRVGIYHFAVLLPSRGDLGRYVRHVVESGAHLGSADHFYSEATYLRDPDGITIEVYRDRPREEWVVSATGELVGPSDRLDVEGLARAAGSEVYHGLPTGTVIGHMHFYVGDLAQAERFYHSGLGFSKVNWSAFPGILFVSAGGYHHHVALNTFAAGTTPASDHDAGLVNWQLLLPDDASLAGVVDNLRRTGVQVQPVSGGFTARDPWGIEVRLDVGR